MKMGADSAVVLNLAHHLVDGSESVKLSRAARPRKCAAVPAICGGLRTLFTSLSFFYSGLRIARNPFVFILEIVL